MDFFFTAAHPVSYPMVIGDSFPGVNQRMNGAIPPLPNTPSWGGGQLKHRDSD